MGTVRIFSRLVQKLLILAIAFEIPFDLNHTWKPFDFRMNNLFFTLFCGLLMLGVLSQKWNAALKIGAVAAIAALSCLLHFEYGPCGILTVLLFYTTRSAKWKYVLQICGLLILSCLYAQVAVRSEVIWMTAPGVISLPSGSHIDAQFFPHCLLSRFSSALGMETFPAKITQYIVVSHWHILESICVAE